MSSWDWVDVVVYSEVSCNIPLGVDLVCKYKHGGYHVLNFFLDQEYGIVAHEYEGYAQSKDIVKFVIIK